MINSTLFTNTDLNATHQYVYTHNLNTQVIAPVLIDGDGINQTTAGIFAFGDKNGNDPNNKVTVSMGDVITGTWVLQLHYVNSVESASGKEIFQQTNVAWEQIEGNDRIAAGRKYKPLYNITFSNLLVWITDKLKSFYFFKTDSLAGINKQAGQTNLGVYSKTYVDTQLNSKGSLLQTNSGAVLGVSNEVAYTPQNPYNPCTKEWAEKRGAVLSIGVTHTDTTGIITKIIDPNYCTLGALEDVGDYFRIAHNLPYPLMAVSVSTGIYEQHSVNYPVVANGWIDPSYMYISLKSAYVAGIYNKRIKQDFTVTIFAEHL